MNRLSPRVQGKAVFAMNSLMSLKDSRKKQKQHKHGFLGRHVETIWSTKFMTACETDKTTMIVLSVTSILDSHPLFVVLPGNLQVELDRCELSKFCTLCPLLQKSGRILATAQAYHINTT